MQLLVVHRDTDVGETLVRMIREFTPHTCDLVDSDEAALAWAQQHPSCDLLLAQVEAEGVDGFALSGSLCEQFPRLQTLFLPPYSASEQRLDVVNTKVFPEPIDGERVLNAVSRAESALQQGADLFHVVDILQMCCLSKKGGAVQMLKVQNPGFVFFEAGRPVHAETSAGEGSEALFEIVTWEHVEFAYDASATAPRRTINLPWDQALIDAVLRHKQEKLAYDRGAPGAREDRLTPRDGPLTGKKFGMYRVGRKLTESFWDEVYEAEETSIGRTAALHVLRSELRDDDQRAQEFFADASANANVHHPAIVAVYEAGESNGTFFYAREFVVGDTLEELQIRGKTFDEATALRIIVAVAEALSYLEANNIMHAPLRISRILIATDGRARLADIAVANPDAAQTAPPRTEIQMLGRVLLPLVHPTGGDAAERVTALLHRMHSSVDDAITSWEVLLREAKALQHDPLPEPVAPPPDPLQSATGFLDKLKSWRTRK
jgi:CheY-like chemotaxis protein